MQYGVKSIPFVFSDDALEHTFELLDKNHSEIKNKNIMEMIT